MKACEINSRMAALALMLTVVACSDQQVASTEPTDANLQARQVVDVVFGEPDSLFEQLEIYWPDQLPAYLTDETALVDAVSNAEGLVHVGFKNPADQTILAREKLGPQGQRRVLLPAISGGTIKAGRAFIESQRGEIVLPFRHLRGVVARVDPDNVGTILRHPLIDYVAPVVQYRVSGQVTPFNMTQIKATEAWSITRGSGQRITILDTGTWDGVNTHRDLPQLDSSNCFDMEGGTPIAGACSDDQPTYSISYGHGTAVAGVALARNNSLDVVGVAASSSFYSYKVCFYFAPINNAACHTDAIVAALELASNNSRAGLAAEPGMPRHVFVTDPVM